MIIFSFIQDNGQTLVNTGFVGREQSAARSQSYQGVKSGILTATKCNLSHAEGDNRRSCILYVSFSTLIKRAHWISPSLTPPPLPLLSVEGQFYLHAESSYFLGIVLVLSPVEQLLCFVHIS